MEILNSLFSGLLGFVLGLISSYIFWHKERRLDKPRLALEYKSLNAAKDTATFYLSNKGGSFAERVRYRHGNVDTPSDLDGEETQLDTALSPGEKIPLQLGGLEPEDDALVHFEYLDVFGKKYSDTWELRFVEEGSESYYLLLPHE